MTTAALAVGLIGTGRISDLHAIEYLQNPGARIVALCDRNTVQAQQKAAAWGLAGVAIDDDIDAFLARPEIDLVEILRPHHLHLSVALTAMAAGKIVSLQKPMASTWPRPILWSPPPRPVIVLSRFSRTSSSTPRF